MKEVLAAVQTQLKNDGTLSAFNGNFWLLEVAEKTPMPFVVVSVLPGGLVAYNFGLTTVEVPMIQISVFGIGALATLANAELVDTSLNKKVLTLSSGLMLSCLRLFSIYPVFDSSDSAKNQIYHCPITFRLTIQPA